MKKTIGTIICIISLPLLNSCSDFFDVVPLDRIVLEDYWTEKSDVDNVLTSCYSAMIGSDVVSRMALWGEVRSDNVVAGTLLKSGWTNDGEVSSLREILKGNLLPSNGYCNWTSIYNVINRCNTVLYYAPDVQKADPNFSESELKSVEAETTALRCLCYFYLIRTFRDVPYITNPSIDDSQEFRVPPTPFAEVLDTLIQELESVRGASMRAYANTIYNTGRITQLGIDAMLADMYLWKQDYAQCIACCDRIIKKKIEEAEEEEMVYTRYPLIDDEIEGSTATGNSYNQIFGAGNSFESLLELYYRNETGRAINSFVGDFYGRSDRLTGLLSVPDYITQDIQTGNDYFKRTDNRSRTSLYGGSGGSSSIGKYVFNYVSITGTAISTSTTPSIRSTNYANWILYRLTDIMLMKAEALVEVADSAIADSCYRQAFSITTAIYNRSNPSIGNDTLVYSTYNTKSKLEELIMQERQRELMFEGKRWFDLVRYAERKGSTDNLRPLVKAKYPEESRNIIDKKLISMDALYFPYSESEVKLNPYLKQNPAYNTETESYER